MKSKAVLILSTLLVLLAISQAYGVKEVYPENGTFKDVIKYSNPGETIFLHNGTYYASGIVIDKNLTIVGEDKDGVVIDAQREGPIFIISSGANVRLINLTLTNGKGEYGGAIDNNGYLEVENCKFKDNYASEEGGAIYNNGYLEISNSEFMGNGDAIANHCILNITRSTFSDNEGSAIINKRIASIKESIFRNNLACLGGAIYNEGYMDLTKCLFTGNRGVKYDGGAIYNEYNGNLTIDKCKFENNSAGYWGGAIHNAGNLKITNSIFNKNMANKKGGAIDNGWPGNLIIDNCIFDSNIATEDGGAIVTDGDLIITNSIFKYNEAGKDGGAIYILAFYTMEHLYPSVSVDYSNVFFNNIPNNIHYESFNYNITLTNLGASTITIKYYITVYTNPVNGKKVGYKEVTITLKPKERKTINLGKYPAGYAVSGTMIVKNPSKNGILLNLRIKYEIERFNLQMREINKYIAPKKEFKYKVRYTGNEDRFIDIW
ncbi:polymorphic outer membrane protein [Methanothermus fervidus DSM 2088]|uniref:Polymorphic outer membrane protein n=1 Tax=Methanothermus fervidus (strain ATCC 43054 / DSM 2088 / JCM 10308 / V24 S) TaxID=523846 RepID=E3GX31_METFV|nr:right-handed parallel beta-helix repeat-containing protein [Methanothermus fervidus]ADP76920.1 polymorphic outer membrane protein [Methanothermus fervidus DSM 2088]